MKRSLFKSKLHRTTVTHANLTCEGSVTIDETLLQTADILTYERVPIGSASNGSRIETYGLPGKPGSGVVCIDDAAARRAGDVVIIVTFAESVEEMEARVWNPVVVRVDARNRVRPGPSEEIAGPAHPWADIS